MRTYCLFLAGILALFLGGCAKKPAHVSVDGEAHSSGRFSSFEALPGWNEKKAESGLAVFRKQCAAQALPSREQLCASAMKATDAKRFFETHFRPFRLGPEAESGLMTGYYEPQLHGAMRQSSAYPYPVYATPSDLVRVELSDLYPDLAHRHLRGRLEGNRLVPYPSRAQINGGDITAEPLCYVSSDIDRFFLHVQGSGRIMLEDNSTLFVGHTDRNGHRRYLKAHPQQKQRILESNPSYIFFGLRNRGATGTLGVELTPMHSVAVDRTKIPLGFPVYYDAQDPLTHRPMREVAMAQDTGSAIKGQVRADLFWGYGEKAEAGAGRMKSPLALWLFVPAEAAPGPR
ncbi:MAG: MltA domain-containing protein [Campylobacterales bacterium]